MAIIAIIIIGLIAFYVFQCYEFPEGDELLLPDPIKKEGGKLPLPDPIKEEGEEVKEKQSMFKYFETLTDGELMDIKDRLERKKVNVPNGELAEYLREIYICSIGTIMDVRAINRIKKGL